MSWVRDLAALAGVGLSLFGLAQWSHALAYFVGGLLLVCFAVGWSMIRRTT